jgi:signal transduction histidine kinase
MPDPGRLIRVIRRPLFADVAFDDLLLAGCVALPGLIALCWSGLDDSAGVALTVVMLVVLGASVLVRRRWTVAAATAGSLACVAAVQFDSFNPSGSSVAVGLVTVGALLWVVVLGYELGSRTTLWWSLGGVATVIVATQWDDLNRNLNPFPTVLAIGALLVGRIVRSRRLLIAALDLRAGELIAERQRYADEAVRHERTWIARELHDVIAHCMSIVVVQASAGQRLTSSNVAATDQILDDIAELARQAESDLAGLSQLLSRDTRPTQALSREVIDQLVSHATSAGTHVDVIVSGDLDTVPSLTAAALNRVLQEGLTNAVKYGGGASVAIRVSAVAHSTTVDVENGPPAPMSTPLSAHSGGNGLRGLRERVNAVGGTLIARTTPAGGWLLRAEIPREVTATEPGSRGHEAAGHRAESRPVAISRQWRPDPS